MYSAIQINSTNLVDLDVGATAREQSRPHSTLRHLHFGYCHVTRYKIIVSEP